MRKEQKDIAELGPIGMIRESVKLLLTHAKPFLLIQLTLMLPVVMLELADQYLFLLFGPKDLPPPESTWHAPPLHAIMHERMAFGWLTDVDFTDPSPFHRGIAQLGIGFVLQTAGALSISAVLYSVGLIYTGQVVSFLDVLSSVTPRLWMRLTVTLLYNGLFLGSAALLNLACCLLLFHFGADVRYVLMWMKVFTLLFITGSIYIRMIFTVASSVSVLEDDCGWSAVKKGLKLLRGKIMVAVLFQVIWSVPGFVEVYLQKAVLSEIVKGGESTWSPACIILGVVICIAWTTLFGQVYALCEGVQYASFKAYQNESIAESVVFEEQAKLEYERMEDESITA